MGRVSGEEYSDIATGLTPDEVASVPALATAVNPLILESNPKILTLDQAASIPALATAINPLALASDARFLTADEKASIPTGASASKQLELDGKYENDLSAVVDGAGVLLDPNWTLSTAGGSTIITVANRLRLYDITALPLTSATLSTPVFNYLPIAIQCYVSSVIAAGGTQSSLGLYSSTGTILARIFLDRNTIDTISTIQSYAGSSLVSTAIANIYECWLRLVLLGDSVQMYYSTNIESNPPSESDWTSVNGFQAMDRVGTPSFLQLSALGLGGLNARTDFSNLKVQHGVEYIP